MTKIRHCEGIQHGPVFELFSGLQTNTEREPQTNAARYSDGPTHDDVYEDMFGRPMPHSVRVRLNGADGGDLRPARVNDRPQTNEALDSDGMPTLEHVKAMILNRQNPEIDIEQNSDSNDPYTPSLNHVAESMGLPTGDRVMSQREKVALAILGHDAVDGMVRRRQRRLEEEAEEGE